MGKPKSPTLWNWPPEMEAAYRKWEAENEETCLCLNCLQARLAKVRAALKETEE